MRRTIELSEAGEASLRDLARSAGQDEDAALEALVDGLLASRRKGGGEPAIRSTPNVMGGDACVRNTRIPVWMLVGYKQAGYSDERILYNYPGLTASDLAAAWDFYAAHSERVLAERRRHEEAD